MNEQEKKAMKKIEQLVEYLKKWNENFTIVPEDTKYFKTILNMIDTYQRMINEQIEEILDYTKEEEKNKERINELINEVTLKDSELEKKGKIIDLMAEQLAGLKNEVDILEQGNKDCFIPREYSDIDDCVKKESCKECIIEYFIKKVEEQKNGRN